MDGLVDMTPLTDRRRKEIATLSRRKGRDTLHQFLVEGVRSVGAAVDAGAPLVDIVVSESAAEDREMLGLLAQLACPVYRAPDRVVGRLGDARSSQGILAVAGMPATAAADPVNARRVLLLDGVQDPGNVGTLLRSAAWFGVDHVVAGFGTADFHGPKVVRASMGAIWDLSLSETGDLAALVGRIRAGGSDVWAADMAGIPLPEWTPAPRIALVVGSEAAGLSPDVRNACTGTVTIPTGGTARGTESLNVAAAAAVLLARIAAV